MDKPKFNLKPTQTLVLGFLLMILLGALLLYLPVSSADNTSTPFIDCVFTSASASCVTGLTTLCTAEHWSVFGKIVILLLIQVGGLGFITLMTTVLLLAGKRITLRERIMIQESLNLSKKSGIVRFVKFLARFTFAIEFLGAFFLTLRFWADYPLAEAIGMGIFHSVSAFCNAGFDIIGNYSLMPYADDIVINVVICTLVITGGLGFPVWVELIGSLDKAVKGKFSLKQRIRRFSLHTKLVLITSAILIVAGAVFTFFMECNNPKTMGNYSVCGKVFSAVFHSVVMRTAGFFTIDNSGLRSATAFFSTMLMMIGGSPCGTAGGIKTISAAVILLAVISLIKDKDSIYAFRRSISYTILQKSLTVTVLMLAALITASTMLSITEISSSFDYEFLDLLFESASALGTVGSSMGITPYLSSAGKIIIIICMFIGRLGPVTIAISFMSSDKDRNKVHYPAEDILTG